VVAQQDRQQGLVAMTSLLEVQMALGRRHPPLVAPAQVPMVLLQTAMGLAAMA
jgi:hypothetical protein